MAAAAVEVSNVPQRHRSAAQVMAVVGCDVAVLARSSPDGRLPLQYACAMVSLAAGALASKLLQPVAVSTAPAEAGPAIRLQSFHTLSNVCRYVHALQRANSPADAYPAAAAGPGVLPFPAGGAADADPPLFSMVGMAARAQTDLDSAVFIVAQLHSSAAVPPGEQGKAARRLECCLLLYLSALRAQPSPPPGSARAAATARRMAVLTTLLQEALLPHYGAPC